MLESRRFIGLCVRFRPAKLRPPSAGWPSRSSSLDSGLIARSWSLTECLCTALRRQRRTFRLIEDRMPVRPSGRHADAECAQPPTPSGRHERGPGVGDPLARGRRGRISPRRSGRGGRVRSPATRRTRRGPAPARGPQRLCAERKVITNSGRGTIPVAHAAGQRQARPTETSSGRVQLRSAAYARLLADVV